jgi:hypothetical protein
MRGALMERYTATVTRVRRETPDTVTLYFTSDREFSYTAGQYITVFFPDSSTPEGKAYSLSSAPHETWLSITVKRVGEYSTRLHALRAGDTFTISAAYGFFNPKTDQPLVGISAGCGLAPIWSIVKDELERDSKRAKRGMRASKFVITSRAKPHHQRCKQDGSISTRVCTRSRARRCICCVDRLILCAICGADWSIVASQPAR